MWHHKQYYNLNQQVTYTIRGFFPKKYQKYPSTTITKHVNDLAKVNKLSRVPLSNIMPWKDVHYYNPRAHNDHIQN